MCAYVNLVEQEKFLKKNKGKKIVTVYKIMSIDNTLKMFRLISPYVYHMYFPGIIKSDSRAKLQTQNNREINKGIHCYISLKWAKFKQERFLGENTTIIKLEANMSDLICVGYNDEVVFRKVKLHENEYKRIQNEKNSN